MWTGSAWIQEERQGGTQKLDGASDAKLAVGRFNTAGPSLQTAANMEQHLHERVRCFQFAYWLSGSELCPGLRSFAECRVEWWSIVGNFGTLSGRPGKCQEG